MTRMKYMSISEKIAASILRCKKKIAPFSAKRCVCLEHKNPQEERRSGCVSSLDYSSRIMICPIYDAYEDEITYV